MHSFMPPEESYSRRLDESVCMSEMPYGYENSPPPYWHQNEEALEATTKQASNYRPYKEN